MAEFNIKNYDGQLYLREDIKKVLNSNPLKAIMNTKTVVMFSEDTPLSSVEKSLKIILQMVKFSQEEDERENEKNEK